MNADGTCIEDTFYFVQDREEQGDYNWTIIHALVERMSDGLRHPHSVAYNTKTGCITDATNDFKENPIVMPLMRWIQLGKVSNMKQYKIDEMRVEVERTLRWDFYHIYDVPNATKSAKRDYYSKKLKCFFGNIV
jgi:hypothetical protein